MKTSKLFILWLLIIYFGSTVQTSALTITKSGGWLESAYVQWSPVSGAASYKVYYTGEGKTDQQIDAELIRQYSSAGYWRADIPGLKAGIYSITVTGGGETATVNNIEVQAHLRTGYAHADGHLPGAYNADGTLKDNAVVVYVTNETKNTVIATLMGTSYSGIGAILAGYKDKKPDTPLIIRIIGHITIPNGLEKGDLVIDNVNTSNCYITIEGIGNDGSLDGFGIRAKNTTNLEISNLAFMNTASVEGDGFSFQQVCYYGWVHNCDFFYGKEGSDSDQVKGDGSLDCKESTYITMSFNHFWDSGKCSLLGNKESGPDGDGGYTTYHHNWFDHSDSRHPRGRVHYAHIYNNYYDGVGEYGAGAALNSKFFCEANYFHNTNKPMSICSQAHGTFASENGGMIKAYNNYIDAQCKNYTPYSSSNTVEFDAYEVSSRNATVPSSVVAKKGGCAYDNFDNNLPYTYTPDTPEEAKTRAMQYAGRVEGGDLKFQFTDADASLTHDRILGISNVLDDYTETGATGEIRTYNPNTGAAVLIQDAPTLALTKGIASPTVDVGVAIQTIVYTASGTATGISVTGLPAGVTVAYSNSNKVATIDGTPSAGGTYNYIVTATNGTSSQDVSKGGTITVNGPEISLSSAAGTDAQTVIESTAITDIVYAVGGTATGAGATGLPEGVTGGYDGGAFTISGSTSLIGTFDYTVTTTGGTGSASASGTITVEATPTAPTLTFTGSKDQTINLGSSIGQIVFTAGGTATGISVSNLPPGVIAQINGKVATISGSPTETGSFEYTASTTGGTGGTLDIKGTITVNEAPDINLCGPVYDIWQSKPDNISFDCNEKKESYTYNGIEMTSGIKMESNTKISFTISSPATLLMAFDDSKKVNINGEAYTPDANKVVELQLEAGLYEITKNESVNMYWFCLQSSGGGTATPAAGCGSVTMADWVYGATPSNPVPSSTCQGVADVSYTYSGRGETTYAESEAKPSATGTYTVTATFPATTAYTLATATADFAIIAGTTTLSTPANVIHSNVTANSFNLSWNEVDGAEKYVVKVCHEEVTGGGGNEETIIRSLTFEESEIGDWEDKSAASTLKTGNGITISQIGTVSAEGKYLQIGNNNADLHLNDTGKDAVLITAEARVDSIIISYSANNSSNIAQPFVGFSDKSYQIGTGNFNTDLGCYISTPGVTGTAYVAEKYTCPEGTKAIVVARGATCNESSSNQSIRISNIKVYLAAENSGSGSTTPDCFERETGTNTTGITINELAPATTYTFRVKAVSSTGESEYSAEAQVTTLSTGAQQLAPTVEMFTCSGGGEVPYDGSAKSVSVTPAEGITGMGAITVKYNGSTEAPIEAGTYTISINVGEGTSYLATTEDIELGCTLTIIRSITLDTPANVIHSNVKSTSFDLLWNEVAGAEKYVVKVCHEEVTGGGGNEETIIRSLTFEESEIGGWGNASEASTLKTGNGITISQIGTEATEGKYLQIGNGNANLLLNSTSNDAVLITADARIDSIIVAYAANNSDYTAQPFVGFSDKSYQIGTDNFNTDLGCYISTPGVTGTAYVAEKYTCPEGTKAIIIARNALCNGSSSSRSIRISNIKVYLAAENSGSGSTTSDCFERETEAPTTRITVDNLDPDTEYACQVKAVGLSGESEYSSAISLVTATKWLGSSNEWNNGANWDSGHKPGAGSNVIIPGLSDGKVYPLLTGNREDNVCNTITFEAGAEIGRQDLLTYNKAYVQYSFAGNDSRNRWHMLSMPLKEAVAGDFAYGGYPKTFLRKFDISETPRKSVLMGTWTNAYSSYAEKLNPGEGFVLWINGIDDKDGYRDVDAEGYGLGKTDGIIQLPFFEDPVASSYHRIHTYEGSTSIFAIVDNSLEIVPGKTTRVERNQANYRLSDGEPKYAVEFSRASESSPFAFISNPFMATIDFNDIYEASKDANGVARIKEAYQIWAGDGFVSFGEIGVSGTQSASTDNITRYIAPQQAFLVEKATGGSDFTLSFSLENFSASPQHAALRSSPAVAEDKLDIVASNSQGSVLAFIAKREYGSLTFGDKDTRKLVTGVNAMPEIYSLKESSSGLIAAGSNVINTDNALIPLGLSTSWEGNMTLTFTGMNRYNAQIAFIDLVAGQEMDLTEQTSYEYTFEYTPARDAADKPVAVENRFFIRFTPSTPTQLADIDGTIHVYNDRQAIHVVASGPVRQVFIHDLRGGLIYANRQVGSSYLNIPNTFGRSDIYLVKVVTEKGIKIIKLINK